MMSVMSCQRRRSRSGAVDPREVASRRAPFLGGWGRPAWSGLPAIVPKHLSHVQKQQKVAIARDQPRQRAGERGDIDRCRVGIATAAEHRCVGLGAGAGSRAVAYNPDPVVRIAAELHPEVDLRTAHRDVATLLLQVAAESAVFR